MFFFSLSFSSASPFHDSSPTVLFGARYGDAFSLSKSQSLRDVDMGLRMGLLTRLFATTLEFCFLFSLLVFDDLLVQ